MQESAACGLLIKRKFILQKLISWTANGPIRMPQGLGVHCGESISLSEFISELEGERKCARVFYEDHLFHRSN